MQFSVFYIIILLSITITDFQYQIEDIFLYYYINKLEQEFQKMNTSSPTKKLKQQCSQNLGKCIQAQKSLQFQQQRLIKNKQRLAELQQRVTNLKEERANKIRQLDSVQNQLKQCKEHKEVLPLIQQLRQHYKKLKQQLGNKFYYEEDDVDVDQMTYQQLLELGQKIGKVSKGLTQQQFLKLQRVICQNSDEHCSICQDNLTTGSECIKLKCGHMYDTDCLKGWFQMEKVCPLCKTESI